MAWDHIACRLKMLDFNQKCFDAEAMSVAEVTQGGYSPEYLGRKPFDEYDDIVSKVERINEDRRASLSGNNRS